MRWLERLLSTVFRERVAGLRLEEPNPYAFRLSHDGARFFRALPTLVAPTAMLYCEGTTEPHVERWLKQRAIPSPPVRIAPGTLWPRPDYYHVPLRSELMEELAGLVDARGVALPCIHVHVYEDQRVLIEWHDAFLDDPLLVSRRLPEERIRAFVAATHARPQVT